MSMQVSYKKQIVFFTLFLIVILGVCEITARMYEIFNPNCSFLDKDVFSKTDYFLTRVICLDHYSVETEKIGIVLNKPNQHYETININSHGFRGNEFTIDKPQNTFRIFMVGGSTIYGAGATSDDKTIPGYLQKKFDEINLKVEVINAGISGAESNREMYLIKNFLHKYKPDLIVVYDGWNDSEGDIILEEFEYNVNDEQDINENIFKFKNFPYYRTPFVIYDILFGEKRDFYKVINEDEISVRTELWKNRMKNICEINYKNQVKTALFIQPILGTGNKTYSSDELSMLPKSEEYKTPLKVLDSLANQMPYLSTYCEKTFDLRNIFDGINEPVFYDLGHMSDFGNKIVAEKIFEEIIYLVE